jgi:hypothetical protein
MSQQQGEYNPFAPHEKTPAVSWAGATPGTSIVGRVLEAPREVPHRDFSTGVVQTWEDGNPKLDVVTRLDINGETRDLWAQKGYALYAAIVEALQRSTGFIAVGGTLRVTYTGDRPSKMVGGTPAKQYAVDYQPPNAFAQQPPQNGQQQQYGSPPPQQQPQYAQPQAGYQERRPTQQQPQQSDPWAQQPQPQDPPF